MARDRDRQRASRRRARSGGSGGPAAGSARASARDSGLEPTDAGLDATPAPEPTKHALPDVEEARMAEAGAPMGRGDFERTTGDPGDPGDPGDSAPDEPAGSYATEAEGREVEGRRKGNRVIGFLGHSRDELKRVQWPDRRQTGQGTAVTLGFVVIAGGFLGLMDAIWQPLVEALL